MRYRLLIGILVAVLLVLQVPLWFDKGVFYWMKLSKANNEQRAENAWMKENNKQLLHRYHDLNAADFDALEELAREELGMIKKDEVFVRLIRDSRHLNQTEVQP